MADGELIITWSAIGFVVVGLFFLFIGVKNWWTGLNEPDPLNLDPEPELSLHFSLRDGK
jgi:hypothetical protein